MSFFLRLRNKAGQEFSRKRKTLLKRLRDYFLTGVVVAMPFFLTAAFAKWVISFANNQVTPLIGVSTIGQEFILPYIQRIPGFGLIFFVVVTTIIGALAAGFFGRYIFYLGENIINRLPILRTIYSIMKQIFNAIINNQSSENRQPVLIEYPRRGCWAIGFATSKVYGDVRSSVKSDMVCVFIPTTPNPTSGFLLLLQEKEVIYLKMSSEDAVKMIVSGGILQPEGKKSSQNKKK